MSKNETKVKIPENLIDELASSFHDGQILENGKTLLLEKEVGRIEGLKIEIFSNEHPPPHFRVIYQNESANFEIKDCQKMNGGLDKWTKNIKKWHSKNKYNLIYYWDEMRPTDCTVGKYNFDQAELLVIQDVIEASDKDSSDDIKYLKMKYETYIKKNKNA